MKSYQTAANLSAKILPIRTSRGQTERMTYKLVVSNMRTNRKVSWLMPPGSRRRCLVLGSLPHCCLPAACSGCAGLRPASLPHACRINSLLALLLPPQRKKENPPGDTAGLIIIIIIIVITITIPITTCYYYYHYYYYYYYYYHAITIIFIKGFLGLPSASGVLLPEGSALTRVWDEKAQDPSREAILLLLLLLLILLLLLLVQVN